jgi:hypothetical protein
MADATSRPGRLIAVEGSRGRDVLAEALALATRLRGHGIDASISRWDASGLFADLALADTNELAISPRMLTLLYAADLVFRLRWELQPALAAGRVVIAAPYLHTAMAVGTGMTLPDRWVRDVLRFAPPADAVRFTKERKPKRGWRANPGRGYGEFAASVLSPASPGARRRKARRAAADWLRDVAESAGAARRKDIVARVGALTSRDA